MFCLFCWIMGLLSSKWPILSEKNLSFYFNCFYAFYRIKISCCGSFLYTQIFFFNFIFWIMGFLLHGAPIYAEKFDHFCIHFVELRVYYGSCLYIQKKKKKKPKPKTKQKVAFCIIFLFIFLNYGFVVLEWH